MLEKEKGSVMKVDRVVIELSKKLNILKPKLLRQDKRKNWSFQHVKENRRKTYKLKGKNLGWGLRKRERDREKLQTYVETTNPQDSDKFM
jgi:hypothetical protein